MERLSVSTYVHKVHQGLFRLTPDPGIKKRPVLTGMQRITAEASNDQGKEQEGLLRRHIRRKRKKRELHRSCLGHQTGIPPGARIQRRTQLLRMCPRSPRQEIHEEAQRDGRVR